MPTYQYACTECAHQFEQVQSFSDSALTQCPTCEGRLRKIYNAVGVVFKGSGFYRNDSRVSTNGDAAGSGPSDSSSSPSESGSSKESSSGGAKESSTVGAPAAKPSGSSGSGSGSGSGSSGSGTSATGS